MSEPLIGKIKMYDEQAEREGAALDRAFRSSRARRGGGVYRDNRPVVREDPPLNEILNIVGGVEIGDKGKEVA